MGVAYGNLGNFYYSLREYQQAVEYHKHELSNFKKVGGRATEGRAYFCLGRPLLRAGSSNEAVAYLRSSLTNFDTIRAYFIWEEAWKISFRKIHEGVYGYFWRVLITLQKTDEALHAAEQGRAQALLDALKIKYGCSSPLTMSNQTEDLALILRKISVLTIFIVMEDETIELWVLGKKSNAVFRQGELKKKGDAHEDFFAVLLKDTLRNIGAPRNIRWENRSLPVQEIKPPVVVMMAKIRIHLG